MELLKTHQAVDSDAEPVDARRRSPRMKVHLAVEVSIHGMADKWAKGTVQSISYHGLVMALPKMSLENKSEINLLIHFPGEPTPWKIRGCVIWYKPQQEGREYLCAAELIHDYPSGETPLLTFNPEGDRRVKTRVSAQLPIAVKLTGGESIWVNGMVEDISQQGLRMVIPNIPLEAGQMLQLRVSLPETESPWEIMGRVVWFRDASEKKSLKTVTYRGDLVCGIDFKRIPQITNKERVLNFLADKWRKFAGNFKEAS